MVCACIVCVCMFACVQMCTNVHQLPCRGQRLAFRACFVHPPHYLLLLFTDLSDLQALSRDSSSPFPIAQPVLYFLSCLPRPFSSNSAQKKAHKGSFPGAAPGSQHQYPCTPEPETAASELGHCPFLLTRCEIAASF